MDELKLGSEINKAIVDGTLKGYLQYLEERREKKKSMVISGAYAWTRGNHIDDQVSEFGQNQDIRFKIEKAGYTWEYLQFTVSEDEQQFMIIIKNSLRVEKSFIDQKNKSKINNENYLMNLADINSDIFRNANYERTVELGQISLELNSPEEVQAVINGTSLQANKHYSRFYIITYEIDEATKFITSIKVTMPNSQTMNLELIEDLTPLIELSDYQTTHEDVAPIMNELSKDSVFSGDANSFGYSIPKTEEEIKEN